MSVDNPGFPKPLYDKEDPESIREVFAGRPLVGALLDADRGRLRSADPVLADLVAILEVHMRDVLEAATYIQGAIALASVSSEEE